MIGEASKIVQLSEWSKTCMFSLMRLLSNLMLTCMELAPSNSIQWGDVGRYFNMSWLLEAMGAGASIPFCMLFSWSFFAIWISCCGHA